MDYFNQVRPTYIENWPEGLKQLSIRQVALPLSVEEAEALGTNMIELFECFPPPWCRDISSIEQRLDTIFAEFPDGAFVRLGSRSPKDALYSRTSLRVRRSAEALALLLGASERIMDDLLLAIANNYPPVLFLREWLDIAEWTEFRCFMKDRQLVGLSQDFYRTPQPALIAAAGPIETAIREFFPRFESACHLDDVVFDVIVRPPTYKTLLLEINPYFELTDPCLFSWNRNDFDGSFRWIE